MSFEQITYDTLKTLGYHVSPIGPTSEDEAPTGEVEAPLILYRRKSTDLAKALDATNLMIEAQIEILIEGNTSQEAVSIAEQVNTLLDNQEYSGYTYFLNNHFMNDKTLTIVHLWYTILNEP